MFHYLGSRNNCSRRAFTLVELLVVVSIILLLTAITVASINFSASRDRVRAGARQIQSFTAGARDRAIHAKEPRGVRFLISPNNGHTAVAMQYIGAPERWVLQGTLNTADSLTFPAYPAASVLEAFQLLGVGSQIEIPSGTGNYFSVASHSYTDGQTVTLSRSSRAYIGSPVQVSCTLLLPSSVIPGSEPVPLPPGVAIDLDGSKVLPNLQPPTSNSAGDYSHKIDILFSPRGNVIGATAGFGLVHLLLADVGDIEKWKSVAGRRPGAAQWWPPVVPVNINGQVGLVTRDQIIVSINGRTGNVGVYNVDITDVHDNVTPTTLVPDGIADQPYSYAEVGEVAK